MKSEYVAEFIGTFMLVFTVGCNVLCGSPAWAVTSIACSLMVSIYALGGVSGANFNPAVSLALGLSKKLEWDYVWKYIIAQLLGGLWGACGYVTLFSKTFNVQPSEGHSWLQAGCAEFFYTFMLCFVVLNVAASKMHASNNEFYGLAIGFSVVAGGYGAGHISGGCFNPAVAFSLDLLGQYNTLYSLVYIVFEVLGAAFAHMLFQVCRPEEGNEDDAAPQPGDYPLKSKLLSEFLGTFMLVLTVGLNVLGGSQAPVWSIAAALMCMIFALGSCSGAHFNPAVTLAILCSGRNKIKGGEAGQYIGVQIFAGLLAAVTYQYMENGLVVPLAPGTGTHPLCAWLMEFFFTFLLAFVVLCVATVETPLKHFFGLAIGSCVTAGGYAIGAISGGSLNPAVSTGLALSSFFSGYGIFHLLFYVLAELAGGAAAAALFKKTHGHEYDNELPEAAAEKQA